MSSDRSLTRTIAPLAVALLLTVAGGCGRKDDPEPPPQKNPARTGDLKVQQRGQTLYVTMTYPSLTMGGLALPGIDRIDYDRYVRPAPEFMEVPPELAGETTEGAEGEPETGEAESPEPETTDGEPAEAEASAAEGTATEAGAVETPSEAPAAGAVETEEMGAERSRLPEEPVSTRQPEGETARTAAAAAPTEGSATGTSGATEQPGTTGTVPAQTAPPNPYLQIRVDADEFKKHREEVLVLEGTELEGAVIGGLIVTSFPLDEIPTLPPVAYSFQVRTYSGHLRSPESNVASFVPLPVPPVPADVTIEPGVSGIQLRWVQPEGVHVVQPIAPVSTVPGAPGTPVGSQTPSGLEPPSGRGTAPGREEAAGTAPLPGTEPTRGREAAPPPAMTQEPPSREPEPAPDGELAGAPAEPLTPTGGETTSTGATLGATGEEEGIPLSGYNVYRRLEDSTLYGAPIATLSPDQTEYLDRGAAYGSPYVYAVTAVRMRQPLVESELSEELTVDYQDVFAPQTPRGLVLLAEAGRTRLVWQANPESDLDGYLVFVRQGGGEPVQLTPEPIPGNEYVHQGTASGATYSYSVIAVDTSGNRSEPSEEATTRAP